MINVIFAQGDGMIVMDVDGHAGFAKLGEDIVCAAASMLSQAIVFALEGVSDIALHSEIADGHLSVGCTETPETEAMMRVARAGFDHLRQAFPDYVSVQNCKV